MNRFNRKRRKKLRVYIFFFLFSMMIILSLLQIKENLNKEQLDSETLAPVVNSKGDQTFVTLDSTSYNLESKEEHQLIVTVHKTDGSSSRVTNQSHYSTSDKNVVTIDENGTITGVGPGFASITANFQGIITSMSVSVSSTSLKVNVKDFGAHGYGVKDETDSFQKAIDYVAAKGGGDVYVPKGTYSLTPIYLQSKVNLVGENRDSVFIKLSDNAPDDYTRVINLENIQDVKIQNITCDGNKKNHPNGIEHMHCIFAWDSKNILIDNNKLINAVADGISISGSSVTSNNVIISNNILEDNHRSNIVLEQVSNLQIFNNTSTSKVERPALHFEPWEEMSFYNAEIWNNTFSSNTTGYCVQLEGGVNEGNFYHNVNFYENIVNCPTGQFLIMETKDSNVHHNTLNVSKLFVWIKNEDLKIFKNKISSKHGIVIEGTWGVNSKRTQITDNNITTKGDGVQLIAGSQDTIIDQNTFTGAGNTGVYFFASETDITNTTVSNNIFKNFDYGIITDYDYYGDNRINGLYVLENKFEEFSDYALYLKGGTGNVTVENNVIKNASGVYITVEEKEMENIKISDNMISGGKQGIVQTQNGNGTLKGLTISENVISDTTGDEYSSGAAIELDQNSKATSDVSISKNVLKNNAMNSITVPVHLQSSLKDNKIHKQ
ncbi:right-handed parallel beta-helix repeat-containing protein [Bacillus sp. MRMR6]|uniref:right-handed parallel beta-helix repeat-containing protein n=1 Tax=Bacillus sp. MRMR6 TaxID=1928617 RepID=UPI0009514C10|nr:right-handed parallel beta-helix repeat-containing protein [Bacillus sp. MRMR6]OLS38429.1 hypothetical protein BTR25_14700 [Bacillus sp. MRMR6]